MIQPVAPAFQLTPSVPGTLGVSGVLSFDTAAAAMQAISAAVAESAFGQLDLGDVRHSDSAGLACVLAVTAAAAAGGKPLRVVRVPPAMQALAKVCEVDQLMS